MDDRVDGCESTLSLVNARPDFDRAAVWLDEFSMNAGLSKDITGRLQVALDEVLSNILNHALADEAAGRLEIGLSVRILGDRVELEVVDDGPAFDPTGVAPMPRAARIAGRREGGVGLLFVRSLMDEVRYTRLAERNCLTLCKRLAATAKDGGRVMEMFESRTADATVVHIIGRVNSSNASELDERLKLLIEAGRTAIVVDLERLDHMTSAGLRCLLRIDKKVRDTKGKLVICGLHGLTLELFEIGGFLDMFAIAGSRKEAERQAVAS